MLNTEQDTYIRPRRVYTIRTAHGLVREEIKKRVGEIISLVPDYHGPSEVATITAKLKQKLMQSRPDDMLAAAASASEWPFMIEAVLLLHKLHGHVNYLYYEPMWGTLIEGRAE